MPTSNERIDCRDAEGRQDIVDSRDETLEQVFTRIREKMRKLQCGEIVLRSRLVLDGDQFYVERWTEVNEAHDNS